MLIMNHETPATIDEVDTEQAQELPGEIPKQRKDSTVLAELRKLALTSGNPEAAAAFLRPLQERSENAQ